MMIRPRQTTFRQARHLLAAITVAAMLAACSDHDADAPRQQSMIGFSFAIADSGTDSGTDSRSLSDQNFETFYVTGGYWKQINPWNTEYVSLFDARRVWRQYGNNWDYLNHEPWIKGNWYKFYAIAVEGDDEALSSVKPEVRQTYVYDSTKGSGKNYWVPVINDLRVDDTFQRDILFAESDEVVGMAWGENSAVSLKFKHILSRVRITFEFPADGGDEAEVSDVTLVHFYNRSSYNQLSGASVDWSPWPVSEDRKTSSLRFAFGGSSVTTVMGSVTSDEAFVIPYDYTSGYATGMGDAWRVQLRYDVTIGGVKTSHVSTFDPVWTAGTAYNYTIRLTATQNQHRVIAADTNP